MKASGRAHRFARRRPAPDSSVDDLRLRLACVEFDCKATWPSVGDPLSAAGRQATSAIDKELLPTRV